MFLATVLPTLEEVDGGFGFVDVLAGARDGVLDDALDGLLDGVLAPVGSPPTRLGCLAALALDNTSSSLGVRFPFPYLLILPKITSILVVGTRSSTCLRSNPVREGGPESSKAKLDNKDSRSDLYSSNVSI